MGTRKQAVGTPATMALTDAGVAFTVHPYAHAADHGTGTSYGEDAAAALGLAPERVFKTLLAEVDRELIVAVVPVSGQLDLKALAAAVGGKRATMADPTVAERATGYVVGGISPFGQRRRLRTVVDRSALDHESVYVSAGRRGTDLQLAGADLVRVLDAHVAPVGRSQGRQS